MTAPEAPELRRLRTLRWWLLGAAFVLTAVAGSVWVVAEHGDRGELFLPILYGVIPAAIPLAAGGLPSAGFRPLTIIVVLVEAFLALWGGWFLLPALVLHLAALFTRRPASFHLVARPVLASVGATVALLVVTEFLVIPVGPADVVGCIDPALPDDRQTETNNAIFDAARRSPNWDGSSGVSGGVAIDLDSWTSDAEVERVVTRVRAIGGVARVERGDGNVCRRSE